MSFKKCKSLMCLIIGPTVNGSKELRKRLGGLVELVGSLDMRFLRAIDRVF